MDFNRKIIPYFADWAKRKNRKPLIVRGARQVGKTSVVLLFAKRYFKDVIHINMERPDHRRYFSSHVTLSEFEKIVNILFGKTLIVGETLLFIDEIQEAPHLIKLLRFFYEDRPQLHVIAAGSLFEVRLNQAHISIPVGRVEFAYLYPLDFFEFLQALDQQGLLKYLKSFNFKDKIPQAIHSSLINLFHQYVLIGGMPEAVKTYAETRDINLVNNIYSNLLTSFKDDVYKYTSSSKVKYLSFVLEQAALFAGLRITYEKFAGGGYRSREISEAFSLMEKAMILFRVKATKNRELPLIPKEKKPPKLVFLDVGLVNFQMGIQSQYINIKDLNDFYRGRIAEQIVAQNIMSSFIEKQENIFYWYKETGSEAEVDFCLTYEGKILGVEVKSGKKGRLRSAREFLKKVKNGKVIKVSGDVFKKERTFISLPFYLLPRWKEV